MKIGELAERAGLNPSAIRYYERVGLLAAPLRAGGQRRYADNTVPRLRLITFAGEMGFTLAEIKVFLAGLRDDAPVGPRWKKLADRKIGEVERMIERSLRLKSLLIHLRRCHCASLELCVERLRLSENLQRIRSGKKPKMKPRSHRLEKRSEGKYQ